MFKQCEAVCNSMNSEDSIIVAFPNRKSIIFDNKLDFSGIKLAES